MSERFYRSGVWRWNPVERRMVWMTPWERQRPALAWLGAWPCLCRAIFGFWPRARRGAAG